MSTRRPIHNGRGRRGNALIEFALAFAFMAVLFAGLFEWSYTFYIYNTVTNNIRSGARYAAQKKFVPSSYGTLSNPRPSIAYMDDVKNMVVYGTPTPPAGAVPVAPGLTTANVEVSGTYDVGGVPQTIKVAISSTNPYTIDAVFARARLSGKPAASFPYTGIFSPAAATP